MMPDLLKSSQQMLDVWYKSLGLTNHLLSPPVDTPRNVIDYGLFMMHHKVGQHWVGATSNTAELSRCRTVSKRALRLLPIRSDCHNSHLVSQYIMLTLLLSCLLEDLLTASDG